MLSLQSQIYIEHLFKTEFSSVFSALNLTKTMIKLKGISTLTLSGCLKEGTQHTH